MSKKKIGLTEDQIVVGTPVSYYSWINEKSGAHADPLESVITSIAWMCGGELVCKLEGKSGGFCIGHLELKKPHQ